MIDIENDVFAQLAKHLRDEFPKINISGEYVNQPTSFPHVSVEEVDNFVPESTLDSSDAEKFSEVSYVINVYSNRTGGKRKAECKAIVASINDWMYRHNFRRFSQSPVPNMENSTIYRMVCRYNAVTDGKSVFRK